MNYNYMCSAKLFSYSDFVENFDRGLLDGIYLVNAGTMSYSGLIRSVNDDSIIMDLPLKFYAGENVMYTPVIIGREEVIEIKEIPVDGHIKIMTKKDGEFAGDIECAYSNRIVINSNGERAIIYYQDFVNIE